MNYLRILWTALPDLAKRVAAFTTILSVPCSAFCWATHIRHTKADDNILDALRPQGVFGLTAEELVAATGLTQKTMENGLRRLERQGRIYCFGSKGIAKWAFRRASVGNSPAAGRYGPRWSG